MQTKNSTGRKKKRPFGRLFLCFLVHRLQTAPLAPLFELDLALHQFLVLGGPVVDALALAAGELNQAILGHSEKTIPYMLFSCNLTGRTRR